MVAGLSSRFDGKIKQFAIVGPNGETLIEYSLNQALLAGFNKIIFVVGEKTEKQFKEKFSNNYKGFPVYYAFQHLDDKRDRPWGTLDALCSALPLIKEPFVVCNGDDIYGKNSFKILFDHLKKENEENSKNLRENAALGYKLKNALPETGKVNRGIFRVDNDFVEEIEEIFDITKSNLEEKNLKPDSLCSMNLFALFPETVLELNTILKKFKEKYKGDRRIECFLPVELSNLIKTNKIKMKIYQTKDNWFGITNPEDEIIVREKLKNEHF